jgi:hypothetical protein
VGLRAGPDAAANPGRAAHNIRCFKLFLRSNVQLRFNILIFILTASEWSTHLPHIFEVLCSILGSE